MTLQKTSQSGHRATDWSLTWSALPSMAAAAVVYFTMRRNRDETSDDDALLQVSDTGGLLQLLGAAASYAADGVLTLDSDTAATLTLKARATAELAKGAYYYDLKMITSGGGVILLTDPDARLDIHPVATQRIT